MILTVDIGNSTIRMGMFRTESLLATYTLPTDPKTSQEAYETALKKFLNGKKIHVTEIKDVIISCVVPVVLKRFDDAVLDIFSIKPHIVSFESTLPIKLLVDNPSEIGADILTNISAAEKLYGGTVLVLDLGTITTFDLLSENAFKGTVITPGLGVMARALTDSGALLPEFLPEKPKAVICTNTIDCMRSGVYFGYIGLVEGILKRIKHEYKDIKVVATGGYAAFLMNEIKGVDEVNPDLTLIGLRVLSAMNSR